MIEKIVKCNVCNKEFIKFGCSTQKYCSKECGAIARKNNIDEKKEKNKHLFNTNKCLFCGKDCFYTNKYCSNECYNNFQKVNKNNYDKVCLYCKKNFNSNRENAKYCSNECCNLYQKNKNKNKIVNNLFCKYCGTDISKTGNIKYCSIECRSLDIINKTKENNIINKNIKYHICKNCNKKYERNSYNIKKEYCCEKCEIEFKNKKLIQKQCLYCKKDFVSKNKNAKYCCKQCKDLFYTTFRIYKHICKYCNTKFNSPYKNRSYCCRQCLSKGINKKFIYGLPCLYNNIKLKSTYELRTCYILDILKNNNEIIDWQYEVEKILYIDENGEHHKYTIDFKILKNNNQYYYIETKKEKHNINDIIKINTAKELGYEIYLWKIENIKTKEKELQISKEQINNLLAECILY